MKRSLVLSCLLAACAADQQPTPEARCREAREQAIERELEQARAGGAELTPDVEAQHRRALRAAFEHTAGACEVQP